MLNILQGKDTVATVPARIVAENISHNQDGYVLRTGKNGSKSIKEIFFGGTKYNREIKPTGKASQPRLKKHARPGHVTRQREE